MTQPADPGDLSRLHDIVTPTPVPWWPPAPGWYIVAALLLVLLALGLWMWLVQRHAYRYRREALAELDRLENRAHDRSLRPVALSSLPELLKRAALTAFPREMVASLEAEPWLQFLDRTASTHDFTQGPGRILSELAYAPSAGASLDDTTVAQLFNAARNWLKQHKTNDER